MWWISLLTLYQLQVNNYYSCFIVAESIPGYCHLARDKRLGCELLFCIWSNVIHFIIRCYNRTFEVSGGVTDWIDAVEALHVKNQISFFLESDEPCNQQQGLWTMSILLRFETHTSSWPHPAPPHTSFIVYSEPQCCSNPQPLWTGSVCGHYADMSSESLGKEEGG